MGKEKLEIISDELKKYIIADSKIEPYVFLYGEEIKAVSRIGRLKDLSISSNEGQGELIKIINSFATNLNDYIGGKLDLKDLNDNNDQKGLFYKEMDEEDLSTTKEIINTKLSAKFSDFLKAGKYKNNFFCVELNLDETGDKKIVLLKSISRSHYVKSKISIKLYNSVQKINFIDKKDLLIDENFEIIAFISDTKKPFFFIQNLKRFEDLFGYHEKYEKAYHLISKKLDFVDWGKAKASPPVKRNCYTISHFDKLDECINQLKEKLTDPIDNGVKQAFASKNILYIVNKSGNLQIIPQNTNELRAVLKIIKDGVAKTYLLGRNVLGSDFEELS